LKSLTAAAGCERRLGLLMRASQRPVAVVNTDRCTGCGWCVSSCPHGLLSLEVLCWRKTSTLSRPEACTGCGLCLPRCPFGVISLQARKGGEAASG
jgi:ferredoxin